MVSDLECNSGLEYKVGDRVQIIESNWTEGWFNLEAEVILGTIVVVNSAKDLDQYLVKVDGYIGIYDGGLFAFREEHLVLIEREICETCVGDSQEVKQYNPLDVQEGGGHYKTKGIQPVEYGLANDLSFPQVNIVKYVTRHEDKNGLEDLSKSIHYHFFEALRCYGVEGSTELKKRVLKMLGENDDQ